MNLLHFGFSQPWFTLRTYDGRNIVLAEPMNYTALDGTIYRAESGSPSDGASTPPILWGAPFNLPPFGDYFPAAIFHDEAYKRRLLKASPTGNGFVPAALTKEQSDDLLKEIMQRCGVSDRVVFDIYQGVHLGGFEAWKEDGQ